MYLSLFSATYCSVERRSARLMSSSPSSLATSKTMARLPSCASESPSIIDKMSEPTFATVARIGWPFSPYKSQKRTGNFLHSNPSRPNLSTRFWIALMSPSTAVPARSPLTSARKTGTPASEKLSAITFRVTVLPEPLAPVISPWRLAIFKRMLSSLSSLFPTKILSLVYILIISLINTIVSSAC